MRRQLEAWRCRRLQFQQSSQSYTSAVRCRPHLLDEREEAMKRVLSEMNGFLVRLKAKPCLRYSTCHVCGLDYSGGQRAK